MSDWRDPTSDDRRPLRRDEVERSSAGEWRRPPKSHVALSVLAIAFSIGAIAFSIQASFSSRSQIKELAKKMATTESALASKGTGSEEAIYLTNEKLASLAKELELVKAELRIHAKMLGNPSVSGSEGSEPNRIAGNDQQSMPVRIEKLEEGLGRLSADIQALKEMNPRSNSRRRTPQ